MKRYFVLATGITAAAVLLSAVIAIGHPWLSQPSRLDSQVLGFWQELGSKVGPPTILEFSPSGTIRIWEGVPRTSPPTQEAKFQIKTDTLVIDGKEAWAARIRLEDGLLAIETNSVTWLKRIPSSY